MSQFDEISDSEVERIVDRVFTDEEFENLFDPIVGVTKEAIVQAYQSGYEDGKAELS